MNTALKAIVDELMDLEKVTVDALGHADFGSVTMVDLIKAGSDAVSVVTNIADLKVEVAALSEAANRQDLEAYVASKLAGVTGARATAIVNAAVTLAEGLVNGIEQMIAALKLPA
jgi:hypothetical protein